ncbi:FAA hydrolase family protein [Nocardioides immobilis]|uniref:FAA hydrolase family protein n=1 Tax=Nocardioides immobilis TaxID=2049295 RepID=A0A417Y6U9_9ACTN|nr:fumarylacetoacetate hydrolase family protein [Nocardioides immobilis]RHW28413.1 FAA hydrolase family protein [Nocardioides immobilis]
MRLAHFTDRRADRRDGHAEHLLGVVVGDDILDITHLVPGEGGRGFPLQRLIEHLENGGVVELDPTAPSRHLSEVQLLSPLPLPPKILAAPVNYLDHKAEMHVEHTVADLGIFLKARTSVIGPDQDVVLPYTDRRFDQEAELGVVIGRHARHLSVESAMDAVFGFTCVLDMSLRSTEDRSTRKSFDTFTPIGPWIVTKDEVGDPAGLNLWCRVNGVERQSTSLADLIFDVPTLVAYASSVMTLEPGDVIATGTPAGVAPVGDGDTIEMGIEGIGTLKVRVTAHGAVRYEDRTGAHLDPSRIASTHTRAGR